jgi:hypothetical protein
LVVKKAPLTGAAEVESVAWRRKCQPFAHPDNRSCLWFIRACSSHYTRPGKETIVKTLCTVLVAAGPLAAAAALILTPAPAALACAAMPASDEALEAASSTDSAGAAAVGEVASDRLAVAGPRGYSRAHPVTPVTVIAWRSCI